METDKKRYSKPRNKPLKYDPALLQAYYNEGYSYKATAKHFKMSQNTLYKYVKLGFFITLKRKGPRPLTIKKKLTDETKRKISLARINFLNNNPDKVPFKINHSSNESYLETKLREGLILNGITGWIQEYQFGRYSFDFAFPDIKLDVEVDGQTHSQEKVKSIDLKRDEYSKVNGWTVLRFNWIDINSNFESVIQSINTVQSRLALDRDINLLAQHKTKHLTSGSSGSRARI